MAGLGPKSTHSAANTCVREALSKLSVCQPELCIILPYHFVCRFGCSILSTAVFVVQTRICLILFSAISPLCHTPLGPLQPAFMDPPAPPPMPCICLVLCLTHFPAPCCAVRLLLRGVTRPWLYIHGPGTSARSADHTEDLHLPSIHSGIAGTGFKIWGVASPSGCESVVSAIRKEYGVSLDPDESMFRKQAWHGTRGRERHGRPLFVLG